MYSGLTASGEAASNFFASAFTMQHYPDQGLSGAAPGEGSSGAVAAQASIFSNLAPNVRRPGAAQATALQDSWC